MGSFRVLLFHQSDYVHLWCDSVNSHFFSHLFLLVGGFYNYLWLDLKSIFFLLFRQFVFLFWPSSFTLFSTNYLLFFSISLKLSINLLAIALCFFCVCMFILKLGMYLTILCSLVYFPTLCVILKIYIIYTYFINSLPHYYYFYLEEKSIY